jgi:hypothetical protein
MNDIGKILETAFSEAEREFYGGGKMLFRVPEGLWFIFCERVRAAVEALTKYEKSPSVRTLMSAVRKPVGVSETSDSLTVVCDDGSVWYFSKNEWFEWSPIPGTVRAINKEHEKNNEPS